MLTGDVMIVDCLDKLTGCNPGYDMKYLESENTEEAERLALLKKWRENFEKNRENIFKKRRYKKEYFGKDVCLE